MNVSQILCVVFGATCGVTNLDLINRLFPGEKIDQPSTRTKNTACGFCNQQYKHYRRPDLFNGSIYPPGNSPDRYELSDKSRHYCNHALLNLEDCVKKIRQYFFVERKFWNAEQMADKVFMHPNWGFYVVLHFGKSVKNLEMKFAVYEILYQKMLVNELSNHVEKMLTLSKTLSEEILHVSTYHALIAYKARSLICTMWKKNETSLDAYISTFEQDENWPTMMEVKDEIYRSCGSDYTSNIFILKIIYAMKSNIANVSNFWDRIDLHMYSIEDRLTIDEYIAKALKSDLEYAHDGEEKSNINIVPVIERLRKTWHGPYFNNPDSRFRYKNIINQLPDSLKNIVLCSTICVRSAYKQNYLYVEDSDDKEKDDMKYGKVSIAKPRNELDTTSEFEWNVRFPGDSGISLENVKYKKTLTFDSFSAASTSSTRTSLRIRANDMGIVIMTDDRRILYVRPYADKNSEYYRLTFSREREESRMFSTWIVTNCSKKDTENILHPSQYDEWHEFDISEKMR